MDTDQARGDGVQGKEYQMGGQDGRDKLLNKKRGKNDQDKDKRNELSPLY